MRSRASSPRRDATQRRADWGFSLIELLASLAIVSVLIGGMTSIIVVMAKALPQEDDVARRTINESRVIDRLASELLEATALVKTDDKHLEFTVPDRDNPVDGVDEIIRYEWAGGAGDPLTRQYQNGPIVNVVEHVDSFDLTYAYFDNNTLRHVIIVLDSTSGTEVRANAIALNRPEKP